MGAHSVASGMSDSLRPQELLPTRLLCPWDSPGKNTRVDFHALLQGILEGSKPHLLYLLYCSVFFTAKPQGKSLKACICVLRVLAYFSNHRSPPPYSDLWGQKPFLAGSCTTLGVRRDLPTAYPRCQLKGRCSLSLFNAPFLGPLSLLLLLWPQGSHLTFPGLSPHPSMPGLGRSDDPKASNLRSPVNSSTLWPRCLVSRGRRYVYIKKNSLHKFLSSKILHWLTTVPTLLLNWNKFTFFRLSFYQQLSPAVLGPDPWLPVFTHDTRPLVFCLTSRVFSHQEFNTGNSIPNVPGPSFSSYL